MVGGFLFCLFWWKCACIRACIRSLLHSVRFSQPLLCAHKRIVNIMKVYIKRNNLQVELHNTKFRGKIATLLTLETLKCRSGNILSRPTFSLLSVTSRHCSVQGAPGRFGT